MKSPGVAPLVVTACTLSVGAVPGCSRQPTEPGPVRGGTVADANAVREAATPVAIPSATRGTGVEPDAGAPSIPSRSVEPERPEALLAHPGWKELRKLWRELDAFSTEGPAPRRPEARLGVIAQEATGIFEALATDLSGSTLDPALLPTLHSVFSLRVSVLQGLESRLMMMHRLPLPGEFARARAGAALETRLDSLLELRRRGDVSGDEYRAALEAVEERLLLLVAVDSVAGRRLEHAGPEDDAFRADTLTSFEAALRARRRTIADAGTDADLSALEGAAAKARRLAPTLAVLLTDFEQ